MNYPKDGTMLLLAALVGRCRLDVAGDGDLVLANRHGVDCPAPVDALDDLEARGWVSISDSGATVTERGIYWMRRWLRARTGRDLLVVDVVAEPARGGR